MDNPRLESIAPGFGKKSYPKDLGWDQTLNNTREPGRELGKDRKLLLVPGYTARSRADLRHVIVNVSCIQVY